MKKKILYICVFILSIVILVYLIGWIGKFIYCNKLSWDLVKKIEAENIDDLNLIIYTHPSGVIVDPPIGTVEKLIELVEEFDEEKIVVSGEEIIKNIDTLKAIKKKPIVPVVKKSIARWLDVYYVLESKKYGKLMEVSMWGIAKDGDDSICSYSMFVNGVEVLENSTFCEIIMPYVSESTGELLIKELQD